MNIFEELQQKVATKSQSYQRTFKFFFHPSMDPWVSLENMRGAFGSLVKDVQKDAKDLFFDVDQFLRSRKL